MPMVTVCVRLVSSAVTGQCPCARASSLFVSHLHLHYPVILRQLDFCLREMSQPPSARFIGMPRDKAPPLNKVRYHRAALHTHTLIPCTAEAQAFRRGAGSRQGSQARGLLQRQGREWLCTHSRTMTNATRRTPRSRGLMNWTLATLPCLLSYSEED